MQEAIEEVKEKTNQHVAEIEARIERLMQRADRLTELIRKEKEERLEQQRIVRYMQASMLCHLPSELAKMKLATEKQEKKLEILMQLLEASRDHLAKSIQQKTDLLNQTREAAERMSKLCVQTLTEEQEFYEQRSEDEMLTPPFLKVKRRPRKPDNC